MNPLEISIHTFSWIAAIVVASLGVPQLINQIKTRKTGNVNFFSFWVFQIGILLWLIWSSLGNEKLLSTFVANTVGVFLYGTMIILLYKYKDEFDSRIKYFGMGAIVITWIIALIFIALKITNSFKTPVYLWDPKTESVMGFIFPAFTTLAFIPQMIFSIKTNSWEGVSPYMFLVYELNNTVWIIFWALNISNPATAMHKYAFVGGIVWQIISFILFGIQFIFSFMDYQRRKKLAE
ncbi:PQ-loop domain-containing transporter [Mycoplasma sp. 4423]